MLLLLLDNWLRVPVPCAGCASLPHGCLTPAFRQRASAATHHYIVAGQAQPLVYLAADGEDKLQGEEAQPRGGLPDVHRQLHHCKEARVGGLVAWWVQQWVLKQAAGNAVLYILLYDRLGGLRVAKH